MASASAASFGISYDKSPKRASCSSPMGASREMGVCAIFRTSWTSLKGLVHRDDDGTDEIVEGRGWEVSTAFIRPRFPSWIKSASSRPRLGNNSRRKEHVLRREILDSCGICFFEQLTSWD
jgi:hypothetical protein